MSHNNGNVSLLTALRDEIAEVRNSLERLDQLVESIEKDPLASNFLSVMRDKRVSVGGSIRHLDKTITEVLKVNGSMTTQELTMSLWSPRFGITRSQLNRRIAVTCSAMFTKHRTLVATGSPRPGYSWSLPRVAQGIEAVARSEARTTSVEPDPKGCAPTPRNPDQGPLSKIP